MLTRPIAVLLLAFLVLQLTGCGSGTPTALPRKNMRYEYAPIDVSHQIAVTLNQFQDNFTRADWGAVEHQFVDQSAGLDLVRQMKFWRQEEVSALHITLLHTRRLDVAAYVGTIQFAGDPRAVPAYAVYLFRRHGSQLRVEGTLSGIEGGTYQHATWSVTRSAHYIVYHSPYQLTGQDRRALDGLEHERAVFAREFGLHLPPLASYYLYPQQDLMRRMTLNTPNQCGANPDNIGCTNPYLRPPSIQTSEWPSYHEPIHVFELAMEPPPHGKNSYEAPTFISEGTAVALEDREADPRLSDYCSVITYVPLDDCARVSVGGIQPLALLSDRGFGKADPGDAYSLAGSFVKYLILTHGYRPFAHFYYVLAAQPLDRQVDYDIAAQRVYHTTIARLLHDWQTKLCQPGC